MNIKLFQMPVCALALLAIALPCSAGAAAPVTVALGSWAESLHGPTRVAVDAFGKTYVTEPTKGEIVVLNSFGQPIEVISGFSGPLAIAAGTDGKFYLSETQTGSVSVFDGQWNLLSQLGSGPGEFGLPTHIAIASGTVYVCDSATNQNKVKYYGDGQKVGEFGGTGSSNGLFDFPAGIFTGTDGKVYVLDQNNDRVQIFQSGTFKSAFRLNPTGRSAKSGRSQGITGDSQGRLYVADSYQDTIKVFTTSGTYVSTIGGYGTGVGQFCSPTGLALDSFNRLLVASVNNGRVDLVGLDDYTQLAAAPADPVLAAGKKASFSVVRSGTGPFSYRWRLNGHELSDSSLISGAGTPTLTISEAGTWDSGDYTAVVTGPGPDDTFTSPAATLTVVNPPRATVTPVAQDLLTGTNVTLSASAWGDNLSYQWQLDGIDIAGATGSTLTLNGVQPENSGRYTVTVTNLLGTISLEIATLRILTPPNQPSLFSMAPTLDGGLQMFFNTDPGFNYTIDASEDLLNWTPVGWTIGDSAPVEYVDPDANAFSQRYYRLRWEK